MMDLGEGILELFAEAQRSYGYVAGWKEESEKQGLHRVIRAHDRARRRWREQNKDKQREYLRRFQAKPGARGDRKARYAELRAAGLSREEARRRC